MTRTKEYNLPEFVYYDKNLDLFKIQRDGVYYNSFKSLKEIKEHRILLEKLDYDLEKYKKFLKTSTEFKNYSYVPAKFIIRKRINGKNVYFDSFETEEEARVCVELLESLDWSKEEYLRLKKENRGRS